MTVGNIDKYVDQSQSLLSSDTEFDEQTTRTKLIDPLINLLGWNLYSSEVELEYRIQMMSSDKYVDYALKLEGDPVVFIEAKGGDFAITEHNIGQLGDYMQKEWVEYGLITNGKQFTALKLEPSEGGPPEIIRLGSVAIGSLNEKQWILELFSKDSIKNGDAEKISTNIVNRLQAVEHLKNNKEAISDDVTDVVTRDLDEAIHQQANEIAQDFVNKLIDAIEHSEPASEGTTFPPKREPKKREDLVRPSDEVNQTVSRQEITGSPQDSVVVVPAKIERGLDFLFRNQAWGFVHIGQEPDYIAFYITGGNGASAVWYVAEVSSVVDIEDAKLVDDPEELIDLNDPNERRKKVIQLEPGSLFELEDPIPYAKKYPQSLRYTTLEKLRTAETTDDLF